MTSEANRLVIMTIIAERDAALRRATGPLAPVSSCEPLDWPDGCIRLAGHLGGHGYRDGSGVQTP